MPSKHNISRAAALYYGVDQTTLIDVSGQATVSSATSITKALTLSNSGQFVTGFVVSGGSGGDPGTMSAGSGTQVLNTQSSGWDVYIDSITTQNAGSYSLTVNNTDARNMGIQVVALLSAVPPVPPPPPFQPQGDGDIGLLIGTKYLLFLLALFVPISGLWWLKRTIFD